MRLFLSVSVAQFRKDYLRALNREKTKTLRKKVLDKSSKKELRQPIDMKFIEKDCSEHKMVSHLRLKALALQSNLFYTDFKKQDIVRLLQAYGTNTSLKSTKKVLGENLIRVLKDDACIKIVNPDSLCSATHLQSMQETHTDRNRRGNKNKN